MALDPTERVPASLRGILILGLALAGGVALVASGVAALPRELVASTNLIGYPTFYDFDIYRYLKIYGMVALGFPLAVVTFVAVLRKMWTAKDSVLTRPFLTRPGDLGRVARSFPNQAADGIVLAILVWLMLDLAGWFEAKIDLGAALAVALVAALLLKFRNAWGERVVAILSTLGPFALYWASENTQLYNLESETFRSVIWMPLGAALVASAIGLGLLWRLGIARAGKPVALIWLGVPLVWLSEVELPGAIGSVDWFHEGEALVGAAAALDGALPWRDLHMIHGPWFDMGRMLIGMAVVEPSRWGAISGLTLLINPAYFAGLFVFFAWASGWRWAPALLGTAAMVMIDPFVHVRLILVAPLLLSLGQLIAQATIGRAFAVVTLGAMNAFTVPEAALATIAVGLVILLRDFADRESTKSARFRRSLYSALAALVIGAGFIFALKAGGAWDGFLHHITVFSRDHALTGGIPAVRISPIGDVLLWAGGACLIALIAAVDLGWLLIARRRWVPQDYVLLTGMFFFVLYFSKFVNRADMHVLHVVASAGPILGLILFRLASLLDHWVTARAKSFCVSALLGLVVVLLLGPSELKGLKDNLKDRWQFGVPSFGSGALASRLSPSVRHDSADPRLGYAGFGTDAALADVRSWREALTPWLQEGDPLLDMTNRPALFHYALGYPPIGRFFHISMALRRESQNALINEIEAGKPKVIIFPTQRGWDGIPDPVRHYLVSQHVLQTYQPVAALDNGLILVPKDQARSTRDVELLGKAVPCDWGTSAAFLDFDIPSAQMGWTSELVETKVQVTLRGWAADQWSRAAGRTVFALLNGEVIAEAVPSTRRADVAQALNSDKALESGFEIKLALDRDDVSKVHLVAEGADGNIRPLALNPDIKIEGIADSPPNAGGFLDSREISDVGELRKLSQIDGGEGVWLILESDRPGRYFYLSDQAPGAQDSALIRVGVPRETPVAIPLATCPAWWKQAGRGLYIWPEDGGSAPSSIKFALDK